MKTQPPQRGGWVPEVARLTWLQRLWEPFWAVPLAFAIGSVGLGLLIPRLDEAGAAWVPLLFHGGPDAASSVLGTITSAMISVTGLVFSITMVVLQLASSQFTPRVLGAFLDSRVTQVTLGVFTGTFLYSLTVLRSVRGTSDGVENFVPQLATSTAYVFVVLSVGLFIAFIHHITMSIKVQEVLARTSDATLRTLDRMIPEDQDDTALQGEEPRWEPGPHDHPTQIMIEDRGDRCITDVDYRALVDLACQSDVVITLDRQVGEYVVAGTSVARVWSRSEPAPDLAREVLSHLAFDSDRELRQDIAFGVRQIVDIAERALSPGVNDPTTAIQAIDGLHSVLFRAVQRVTPSAHVTDHEGTVRLVYRPQTVEQLLDLAITEIAHWGRESVRVPDHLRRVLDSLDHVALPRYKATIEHLRKRVDDWQESA